MSIYRSVKSPGATSSYQQQQAALATLGLFICPRQQFFDDLALLLEPWHVNGDRIIVGGDFNSDVRSEGVQQFFE